MSSSTRCVAHRSPTNHNSRRWIDFSSLDTLMQNVVVTSYNSHVASLTPGMTSAVSMAKSLAREIYNTYKIAIMIIIYNPLILFDVTMHHAWAVTQYSECTRVRALYM